MNNCRCTQNGLNGFLDAWSGFVTMPGRWVWDNLPSLNTIENRIDNALYGPFYDWYQRNSPNSTYAGKLNLAKATVPPPPAPVTTSDMQGGWTPEKLDTARRSQLEAHWTAFKRDPIVDPPADDSNGSTYLWAGIGVIGAIILLGQRR